jgi:hypothetical protein
MRWRSRIGAIVLCMVWVGYVRPAAAQSVPAAGPGRLEVSVGALWVGHQALGSNDANETTPGGGSLKIFTTSSDLASVAGLEGRIAVRLMRSLEAEVEASYGTPGLKITISGDIENAPPATAIETVRQFTVGAGVVWYVPFRRGTERLVPFVTAGGGHLRQIHEERTFLETGQYYQVGGGVKYLLFSRPRGFMNAIGARVDVRAVVRRMGVAFDNSAHTSPAFGAAAFVRF